jgi:toxin YoeB
LRNIKIGFSRIKKIGELIIQAAKTPFEGIGKPEPLKHQFKGYWSRRISQEHRIIYKATDSDIVIISCYSHYK